jgi:phospholipid/cholesterol/gamma-HCH transport system substrate-binding protein
VDTGITARRRQPADADRTIARDELRQIVVGAAAILLFAAVLVLTYAGVVVGADMSSHYRIFAMFNRVDGLAIGDDVQLSGVPVGKVDSMTLGPYYRARVGFGIASDVPIPTDTSVSIQTDGLFGGKFVVLEPGGEESMLADGSTITFTQDSLIVGELLDLVIAEGRAQRAGKEPDQTDATQPH